MPIRRNAAAAALVGLALAGCQKDGSSSQSLNALLSTGPDAQTREMLGTDLAEVLEAQGQTMARFNDTTNTGAAVVPLNALLSHAMVRNPSIGQAAQKINQAEAERMRAIYAMLPQIYVNFTYDGLDQRVLASDNEVFEEGETMYPVKTSSASIVQPLFDPARRFRLQLAKNVKSGAEVDYIGAVRDVVYEVFDNYIVANQARARMASLKERRALIARQISSQGDLVATGLSNVLEASSLRSERDSTAAQESLEAARYAEALSNLASLTGMVISDVEALTISQDLISSVKKINVDTAVADALENNPGIMSAALQVVGSEIERKEAHATDISPVLEAYATIEREDRADSRFGGGSLTLDRTLGVSLTIPIFNSKGTGLYEPTKRAAVKSAVTEYHVRRRAVETEVRTTHARLMELTDAISQSQNAAYHAGKALEVEQQRVASGESVDLAVAARQLRLNEAREQMFYYRAEFMRSWARLNYLMGADLTRQGF